MNQTNLAEACETGTTPETPNPEIRVAGTPENFAMLEAAVAAYLVTLKRQLREIPEDGDWLPEQIAWLEELRERAEVAL